VSKYITSDFQKKAIEAVDRNVNAAKAVQDATTDEAYERIKKMVGADGPTKKVNLTLKPVEKQAFYHDVLHRLRSGDAPENIARDVLACVEELLQDKQDESTGKKGPAGPIFRRVSE
jgi:hypothetical protein